MIRWFIKLLNGSSHLPPRKRPAPKAYLEDINRGSGEKPIYQATGPAVEKHFALIDRIEAAWKGGNRAEIVRLCEMQIANSAEVMAALREEARCNGHFRPLITHTGFTRLAMLYEREGSYHDAIDTCHAAINAGWSEPEFSHRASRCRRKLSKGEIK